MLQYVMVCDFHSLPNVSVHKACFYWSGLEFSVLMFVCVLISFVWLINSALSFLERAWCANVFITGNFTF